MARRHQFRIRMIGHQYHVCDLDGAKIGGGYDHQYQAEDARDRMERRGRAIVRPCITCGADFRSEGPHNRMCGSCSSGAARLPAQFLGV
jgi:hypothetical protein